jgi:hypothetical protein
MRHVRLLCLLLIAKITVCNALLPAPTFSSRFAVHMCSSHSSGAMKRLTTVMAAAPNASEPVCCSTFALARAYCGWAFQAVLCENVLTSTCVLCGFVVVWCVFTQVRITPDKPMRQRNPKARSRHCKHPACTINASFGYAYDKKPIRCVTHVEQGMICVIGRACEEPNCGRRACFGPPNTTVSSTEARTAFF